VPRLRDPQRVKDRDALILARSRVGDLRTVARQAGCSHQLLNRLESGERGTTQAPLGRPIALGIAAALGRPLAELFEPVKEAGNLREVS
jgi:transcriptional regulator with XRE-family HTH domain